MKKSIITAFVLTCAVCLAAASEAAEQKQAPKVTPAQAMRMPYRPNMMMVSGTVTKINSADPKNITLEIKNASDGNTQTVTVMPWTRIIKNTDISELKPGDKVQAATRKTEDNKEVAMSVMFGKIQSAPMLPRPAQPAPKK